MGRSLKTFRFVLGLAISGLFMAFFLSRADLGEMGQAFTNVDYWLIAPAVFLYLFSVLWRTLRWRALLRPLGRVPLARVWQGTMVGYAATNLLPFRLGDVVRAYYLGQRTQNSTSAILATVLVERVFDGLVILLLVGLVAPFVPVAGLFRDLGRTAHINWLVLTLGLSIPFFTIIALLALLVVWPDLALKLKGALGRIVPVSLLDRGVDLALRFTRGLAVLRSPRESTGVFFLSLPVWLCEVAVYLVLLLGFGVDSVFDDWGTLIGVTVLVLTAANLGSSLPTAGGGVGSFEFFAQITLVHFGVGAGTASAYAIIVHATIMLPVTVLGLAHLWLGEFSLLRVVLGGRRDRLSVEPGPEVRAEAPNDGGSGDGASHPT